MPPWTGIKQATESEGYFCPQMLDLEPFGIVCNEDCLYLNVYTNSLTQSKPVMVWIHGGSFIVGSSSFQRYRADYLLAKDVVVVTVNYRLGAFGLFHFSHLRDLQNIFIESKRLGTGKIFALFKVS